MEYSNLSNNSIIMVLSSPSGAGKSTLSKILLNNNNHMLLSISATTRKPRSGEINGKDYFFLSVKEFKNKIYNNEMLEWAKIFGNFYGTIKKPVYDAMNLGKDVLFDIDWQGVKQLDTAIQKKIVKVFILPPTINLLEQRLYNRAQDNNKTINIRMKGAFYELKNWNKYDYTIINYNLQTSKKKLKAILYAEKQKNIHQNELNQFVKNMQNELKIKFN